MISRFLNPQRMVVHLTIFAAAIALPLFALASTVAWFSYTDEIARLDAEGARVIREVSQTVEREIGGIIDVASTLAVSKSLRRHDLAEFYETAKRLPSLKGRRVLVVDEDGNQLMNTKFPYGTPLLVSSWKDELRATVFEGRGTFVSPSFYNPEGELLTVIGVPVFNDDQSKVIYSLNFLIPATEWQELAGTIALPKGWLLAVVDGQGRIMARTKDPEKWVGNFATANLVQQVRNTTPGSPPTWGESRQTIEGLYVTGGLGRLKHGWAVGLSVLNTLYYASLWKLVALLALFMNVFVLIAAVMASIQGKTITRALTALSATNVPRERRVTPVIEINDAVSALVEQTQDQQNLLRELHHRVKNNLQTVASVLRLQMVSVKEPKAKEALDEAIHRVMAMGKVHETLYEAKNTKVEAVRYISMLVEHVAQSLPGVHIKKDMHSLPMPLTIDHLVPIALLINEVVVNAAKHAKKNGHVQVSIQLMAHDPDSWCLSICDDGQGLPPDFEKSKSLGMKLIKAMALQLNGTISFQNTSGACVKLIAPLPKDVPFKSAI